MTKISGKPDGTYVYAWNNSTDDSGSFMFTFDGNNYVYTTSINLYGYSYTTSFEGKIKLNGAKATIKECTNENQVGMELVSSDRWLSFEAVDSNSSVGPFKKQ